MRLAKLSILVLLGWSTSVLADGNDKAEAKKHVDVAKRHYNVAKYDEAIAEFKEAYTLDPDPKDLFNIAQAYRLKKDCENAALFYANYQREEKNKKLRDSVTKVRADMETCAKERVDATPKPVDPPPPVPTQPPTVAEPGPVPGPPPTMAPAVPLPPPVEAQDPDPNRIRRITGKVVMVGGGALIAIGVLEAMHVGTLDKRLDEGGCDTDLPDDNCPELQSERDRSSNAAAGSVVVGGLSVILGFVLWRVSMKPDRPALTLSPRRNGAVLTWHF